MPSIRVLLGALPTTVRDAVSDAVGGQADVELIGVAAGPSELLRAASALRADVVVVAAVAGALPGVATHLLDQHPDIRVLAVTGAGTALSYRLRPHLVEFACSTPAELAAAIRANEDPDM
ncbi:hypothetical protein AB0F73_10115 [Micromonospora purpureochromogenes]|uniref:hypothetical protein n=1 Tax=Micromonospora purpureochromogenes TaxID=47872 RepID=UPI0033FF49EC